MIRFGYLFGDGGKEKNLQFGKICWIAAAAMLIGALTMAMNCARRLDKVRFGTYRKYGLDVTIVPGGPNVNNRILLPVGKLDFFMSANSLQSFDAVAHDIPTVTVAARFQKDPQ